jgi:CBS domain-containing protein
MPQENAMKVGELMTRDVRTCLAEDNLNRAAQLMWEGDCGIIPVLGADGGLVGVITDRDICMAAYTKGRPLASLRVQDAMAREVSFCSPDSTLETAMSLMREMRIHRLPVVDAQGQLAGILSLNDLALEARKEAKGGGRQIKSVDVAETLGVLCDHRTTGPKVKDPQGKRVDAFAGARV